MMRFLADILTFSRILGCLGLSIWLLVALFGGINPPSFVVVLLVAVTAFLTDAFDGICARRWPHSKGQSDRLFYRKDAHLFDNLGDTLLYIMAGLSLGVSNAVWLIVLAGAMAGSFVLVAIIEKLHRHGSVWAERVDVIFGWVFGITLSVMLVVIAAIAFPDIWVYILGAGIVVAGVMVPSKWDRLTSRPERRIPPKEHKV